MGATKGGKPNFTKLGNSSKPSHPLDVPKQVLGMEDGPLTLIFPGAAQIFPVGPSSAGQHPGHNQEGKLTKQPWHVPLQGKRGLCSVAEVSFWHQSCDNTHVDLGSATQEILN